MTIKNFTFFSPNGTEFPVGSNNDAKLYMMLSGMDYTTFRRTDWSSPVNIALNVQYVNTSFIVAGRYFELINETVALNADSLNYIHINIDLTKTAEPVSLSCETADNSNTIDLNNDSGVYKRVVDIITTNGLGVTNRVTPTQKTTVGDLTSNSLRTGDLEFTGNLKTPAKRILASGASLLLDGDVVNVSKNISDCANGWILHFTEIKSRMNGNTKNSLNQWFFIPKESVQLADVGHSFALANSTGGVVTKFAYLQGNRITGHGVNNNTSSKQFALQHVLEY